jgi:hypothetical protein
MKLNCYTVKEIVGFWTSRDFSKVQHISATDIRDLDEAEFNCFIVDRTMYIDIATPVYSKDVVMKAFRFCTFVKETNPNVNNVWINGTIYDNW